MWLPGLLDTLLPACCPACLRHPGPACCARCQADLRRVLHPCPACAAPRLDPGEACSRCAGQGLRQLTSVSAPWAYRGTLRALIHRAKGAGQQAALRELSRCWPDDLALPEVDALCVVPPAAGRQRGRHLASALAGSLAARLGRPLLDLLRWQVTVCAQHRLGERDRRRNLAGSLVCIQEPPTRVLLVDDILTTGATCSEAARALRAAGCRQVAACCLARSPRLGDQAVT